MKMMWAQLFPANIDNCIFSDCPCGFLRPQNFRILQLAWTLLPNKFLTLCPRYLIFALTIVNHFYIHLIASKS